MMQRFVCLEWMFFYVSKEWKKRMELHGVYCRGH